MRPHRVHCQEAERSLERLRTDYVDIYYAHRDDLTTTLDEVVSVYDEILQSGQARVGIILPPGAAIELLATDAGSIKDVAAWCKATGNELVEQTSDGAVYRFVIRRK